MNIAIHSKSKQADNTASALNTRQPRNRKTPQGITQELFNELVPHIAGMERTGAILFITAEMSISWGRAAALYDDFANINYINRELLKTAQ